VRSPFRRATALVLLLAYPAAAQDAPVREVVEVRTAELVGVNGDERQVAGGAWLSDPTMIDVAKELAGLRAEVKVYRTAPATPPVTLVVTATAALLAGLATGVLVGRAIAR
jgi:hypothetical protein